MASISVGGQPWRVDSVMEREMLGVMPSTKARSTLRKRPRLDSAQSTQVFQTSVPEASIMPLMYVSTLGLLMPARS